jgi:hypothetical protein
LRGRTGLSACIFFAAGKKGYRFNPLREPKPLRGLVIAGAALGDPQDKRHKNPVKLHKEEKNRSLHGVFVTYPVALKTFIPYCGIFWGSHRAAFNRSIRSHMLFRVSSVVKNFYAFILEPRRRASSLGGWRKYCR